MFWYGVTFLCALLANYGLGNMLLKEIAQHPESVTAVLGESLSLQLMLSATIFLCVLGGAIVTDRPELLLSLLLAHLIETISSTFYFTYRAMGHYARESQLAACAAIVQLILVFVAIATNQTTGIIAFAYLAGKIVQLALVLPVSRRVFGLFSLQSIQTTFKLAMHSKAYAIDNILGSVFGNIDSVVLRASTGVDVVGIYQSGMRIFQGGAQAAPILANVFLPEMARNANNKEKRQRIVFVLQASFLIYGLFFGLCLSYFSEQIVNLAFGEDYRQLAALFPLFGLLFFGRFFTAAWGVILTAIGHQAYRAKATAIYLLFALSVGSYLSHIMQAKGWLIGLILANALLAALYIHRTVNSGLGGSFTFGISMLSFGSLLFVPMLFWR
jgi:O-antigen/teichoic acid export membrane protein